MKIKLNKIEETTQASAVQCGPVSGHTKISQNDEKDRVKKIKKLYNLDNDSQQKEKDD